MLEQLASKFNCASRSTRCYRTKAGTPVILFEYYQQSNHECVARYFKYSWLGSVFKDLLHNVWYTDAEELV